MMVTAALAATTAQAAPAHEVLQASELEFQPLNPTRGDASPQAGILWGNILENTASGVLLKFADGFSSPPHIHNITYRAVVISGAVHNDDPNAEKMWMGPGSFWTQPAGEPHITSALPGSGATAFLEIEAGPYLVQPQADAFDNGERPLNLEASNIVWLDATEVDWLNMDRVSKAAGEPQVAFLWGSPEDGQENGSFLKLPRDFNGRLNGAESWLRAIVISGSVQLQEPDTQNPKTLEPGSYFGSKGEASHTISCETADGCVLYLRATGRYTVDAP